jgi:hypothetical protein
MGADPSIEYVVDVENRVGYAYNPLFPDQRVDVDANDFADWLAIAAVPSTIPFDVHAECVWRLGEMYREKYLQ